MMGSSHTLLYYGRRFQSVILARYAQYMYILAQVMALESCKTSSWTHTGLRPDVVTGTSNKLPRVAKVF